MKVVLLGPRGQLGQDLQSAATTHGGVTFIPIGRDQVDLADLGAARATLQGLAFDALINTTGYHKTDEVEGNAAQAMQINAHLVKALAEVCREKEARFITLSTDYVFGGQAKRAPLTEDDPTAPVNVYGASKAFGESLARAVYPEGTLVARVSSLFGVAGASGKGGNFVETMLRLAKERGALKVVDDQVMAPTATADIAIALVKLLEANAPAGIYHIAGTGPTSWWGFAKEIIAQAGLTHVPVDPVPTSQMPTPAMRPAYSVLDNTKLSQTLGWTMPAWQDALRCYLVAKGHIAAT
jgi:dTDP-4-dehydrorhamnose reductase